MCVKLELSICGMILHISVFEFLTKGTSYENWHSWACCLKIRLFQTPQGMSWQNQNLTEIVSCHVIECEE